MDIRITRSTQRDVELARRTVYPRLNQKEFIAEGSVDLLSFWKGGRLLGIAGVKPHTMLGDTATAWVCVRDTKLGLRSLVKYGKKYIKLQSKNYPNLYAAVLKGSDKALRYAQFLGFEIDPVLTALDKTEKHHILRYKA